MSQSRDREATVMVVEDEVEFRLLLRVLLDRAARCRVVAEAEDGLEAIDLAAQYRPDVIILDIHMPKSDGFTALERIEGASPASTVIVMSSDPDTRPHAIRLGLNWVDKARLMHDLPGILASAGVPGVVA